MCIGEGCVNTGQLGLVHAECNSRVVEDVVHATHRSAQAWRQIEQKDGRRHGEGVFRYPNGDVYSGWWKHGQKEGTGTYTFKKTGHKLFGDWEAGKIVKGKWIYPEGLQFSGDFANNKPNGLGEWLFKNGNKAGGSYVQTKKEWTDDEVQALKDAGKIAEDAEPPAVYDIAWVPSSNISESAELVNKVPE